MKKILTVVIALTVSVGVLALGGYQVMKGGVEGAIADAIETINTELPNGERLEVVSVSYNPMSETLLLEGVDYTSKYNSASAELIEVIGVSSDSKTALDLILTNNIQVNFTEVKTTLNHRAGRRGKARPLTAFNAEVELNVDQENNLLQVFIRSDGYNEEDSDFVLSMTIDSPVPSKHLADNEDEHAILGDYFKAALPKTEKTAHVYGVLRGALIGSSGKRMEVFVKPNRRVVDYFEDQQDNFGEERGKAWFNNGRYNQRKFGLYRGDDLYKAAPFFAGKEDSPSHSFVFNESIHLYEFTPPRYNNDDVLTKMYFKSRKHQKQQKLCNVNEFTLPHLKDNLLELAECKS